MPNDKFKSPWRHPRIRKQPKDIPAEMIESQATLPSGATYTRLKPMYASGTEEVERWKAYRL